MEKNLSEQLADNLAYYVNNPSNRCISENGKCSYSGKAIGKDTEGCFVGRLMKPIDRQKADDYLLGSVTTLIEEAKEHDINLPSIIVDNKRLMRSFQMLHDDNNYWTTKGLNAEGKDKLHSIVTQYNLEAKYFEKFLAE